MKTDRDAAEADPLIAIAGGGGVALFNSMGDAWTADYLKITGELDVDLRSNIAVEARARSAPEFSGALCSLHSYESVDRFPACLVPVPIPGLPFVQSLLYTEVLEYS